MEAAGGRCVRCTAEGAGLEDMIRWVGSDAHKDSLLVAILEGYASKGRRRSRTWIRKAKFDKPLPVLGDECGVLEVRARWRLGRRAPLGCGRRPEGKAHRALRSPPSRLRRAARGVRRGGLASVASPCGVSTFCVRRTGERCRLSNTGSTTGAPKYRHTA